MKNKYPLPLISELINKLQGARYFTKLDVHWGFNNVQMKEGDEWKAAFQTNQGLYEPLVMFFGLTNSLATFQTMMDRIFEDLISEGVVVVYLDDILIFTKTLDRMETLPGRNGTSVQDLDGSQELGVLHVCEKTEPEASQMVTAAGYV